MRTRSTPDGGRGLPEGSLGDLCELINLVEARQTWPSAVRVCLVQLLPKAATADRPITLTQGLYRLWGRIRRPTVAAWSAERAAHWDRAVAGSAPLRAAILRQLNLEAASAVGISRCEVLWDLAKFNDTMGLAEVATVGAKLEYPLVCLLLGFQMAATPRRVRADQCV